MSAFLEEYIVGFNEVLSTTAQPNTWSGIGSIFFDPHTNLPHYSAFPVTLPHIFRETYQ